jgi:hypothetical protein
MNNPMVLLDRPRSRTRRTALLVATAGLGVLTLGCATGLPYMRPGSNITLRDSPARQALQALVTRCDRATASPSGATSARDVVDCGRANTRTVAANDPQRPSTSGKMP